VFETQVRKKKIDLSEGALLEEHPESFEKSPQEW